MVSCLADINEILSKVNKTKHIPIRKKAKRRDITKYSLCVYKKGAYWTCGLNVGIWIQSLSFRSPTLVCSVLEQENLSELLQSTQLWIEYQERTTLRRIFCAMNYYDE